MARRFFCICAGLFLLSSTAARGGVVAITSQDSPLAIMEDGDVLRYEAGNWNRVQNVFTYSNHQGDQCRADGRIVGAANPRPNSYFVTYLITDSGYLLGGSQDGWAWACMLEGRTIFEAMERPPGTIIAFGEGTQARDQLIAITTDGDAFQLMVPASLTYLGNIFGGATPGIASTIGSLKARYR